MEERSIIMKLNIFLVLLFVVNGNLFSQNKEKITSLNWNGVDVVWIEDNRLPTYNVVVYFADGALSDQDNGGNLAETEAMFSLLNHGTLRFSFKEISDNLEFYGTSYGHNVTHEYSTYGFSGLVKDIVPATKMICHLFRDAAYPADEVANAIKISVSEKNNMVTEFEALTSRVFRELSLSGSPYNYPVDGKIKDILKIKSSKLLNKLKYFNQQVYKKIYIAGPADTLQIRSIINDDCGWSEKSGKYVRGNSYVYNTRKSPSYFFVPVKGATAAYVRVGSFFDNKSFFDLESLELASTFLGGGFTSKLMREIRVKRGLSYGISAFGGMQKNYGRVGIVVSTESAKVPLLFTTLQEVLSLVQKGDFAEDEFKMSQGFLTGSYSFRFEKSSAYINQLLYLDHVGVGADKLYSFPETAGKITKAQMVETIKKFYDWNQQVIVVLGDMSMVPSLKAIGDFKIVNYKDFL